MRGLLQELVRELLANLAAFVGDVVSASSADIEVMDGGPGFLAHGKAGRFKGELVMTDSGLDPIPESENRDGGEV